MNFNILKEFRKMLELMDKSKTVKHFMWGLLITLFLFGIWWKLPEFILSIRWW